MKVKTDKFVEVARKELGNSHTRGLLSVMTTVISAVRHNAMSTFPDPQAATEFGRAIRVEAVARLPELLEEFEKLSSEENSPESTGFFSRMKSFLDGLSE